MSNSIFDWPTSLKRFVRFTSAKAEDVNDALDDLSAGLDTVEADINRAVKLPVGTADQTLALAAGQRAGLLLGFDPSGNIAGVAGGGRWRGDWSAGTQYVITDYFRDPVGKSIYVCVGQHTATSIAADLAANNVRLAIDVADVENQRILAQQAATEAGQSSVLSSQKAVESAASAATSATKASEASESAATASTKASEASASAIAAAGSASAADADRIAAEAARDALFNDLASTAAGKGSELVAFKQGGADAVDRTAQDKLRESASVKDFGAVGDGSDATAAFSAAAKGAPAAVNIVGAEGGLPRAPMCRVTVPAGSYVLSGEIDTGNREVIWDISPAAVITGYAYLNGEVFRPGQRQADYHHGTTDYACTYSIRSNVDLDDGAEVLGIQSASQLATYADRDSVGLYVDNYAPSALLDANAATYTSTTVTVTAPTASVLKKYRRGMIVDTKHSPKWSGIVDSWSADGSVLTVTGWYEFGGGGTSGTPVDGAGCVINAFTKVWAHNANVFLKSSSHAGKATGFELGVFNDKGALDFGSQTNVIWGYDAVSLGAYEGAVGFIARAAASKFFRGFQCSDATNAGFVVGGTPSRGFYSEQSSGDPFVYINSGISKFKVDAAGVVFAAGGFLSTTANASLSLGSVSAVNTPFIDFNSSGNNIDYDVRIVASGGTATNGSGILTITAGAGTRFAGVIQSNQDNVHSNGTSANRWSVVYAGTGTINTSDEREKQDIAELDDAERRVAQRLKALVKKFRFRDAVAKKGADARIHVGVIAQEVISAFEAEGLDAARYGIICYDEWDEMPAQLDAEGSVVQEAMPAGNRYGVRYEELFALIIASL